MTAELVTGNVYDKYRTRNPIYRRLTAGFLGACRELLQHTSPQRVLEVGCGPGDLAQQLARVLPGVARAAYLGIDLGLSELRQAQRLTPGYRFSQASAYALPVPNRGFDCVLACEVFEHLDQPELALAEVRRVASGILLLSVPWEPVWRVLNLARGSYWRQMGNTPGHVQHFSRRAIRALVASQFEIIGERHPFPWTVLLARLPS